MIMASHAKTDVYVRDYPNQLNFLRQQVDETEPGLVFGLWVLLARAGVRLTWGDAEVLSGQALQFAYSRQPYEASDRAVLSPLDALSRALGVTWTEFTPSSALKAFDIAREWVDEGALAIARFRQPMLVFGYSPAKLESVLHTLRIEHRLPVLDLNPSECDRWEWRLQIDEGNSLLRVNFIEHPEPDWMGLLPIVVRRAIANWRHEPHGTVEFGLAAYRAFAADLRNPDHDFTNSEPPSWMGPLLYRQIQARTHIHQFLDRMAPRFGGKPRQVLAKASTNYGQCAVSWRAFAQHLGRVYEKREHGKALRGPDTHVLHWRDPQRRNAAAQQIDQAALWEARAITELAKLLGT
ncbi:MAG: hypothetical protein IPH10_09160 [bacterium]|nr:hypothetical protein [bacterium]